MPAPLTWAEHDREHKHQVPFFRTGGNDTRGYVLDAGSWPDVLRCGQCGRDVQRRRPDDPPSFLTRDDTTRKATT
jgi:hypothetical protein